MFVGVVCWVISCSCGRYNFFTMSMLSLLMVAILLSVHARAIAVR